MSRPAAKPIPDGYHTLTPFLICKDAVRALDFYQRAFGAEVISSLVGPDKLPARRVCGAPVGDQAAS